MAVSRPNKRRRVTPAAEDGDSREPARARALADATARISDQSGRLAGEEAVGATAEDAAHWIAVYSELLAFKAELLEITARRRSSMSEDARGEAEADGVVIGAQADKYTRRLQEWRAQVTTMAPAGPGTPALAVFVEGRARTFGHLLIDPWRRTVKNGGRPLQLTPGEWRLLRVFLEHPGQTVSRAQLAGGAGDDGFDSELGRVAVYVSRLRRKLETAEGGAPLIETVRGAGYRLTLPPETGDPLSA
ncbi:MAG TPA: winged helix-turn-helix domain-containing protein [Candidatus Dormibacteraeota bacterium]|jgi:DNA-binding response OmpR family regulator